MKTQDTQPSPNQNKTEAGENRSDIISKLKTVSPSGFILAGKPDVQGSWRAIAFNSTQTSEHLTSQQPYTWLSHTHG